MSTINQRSGSRLPSHFRKDNIAGTSIDPGPHIGKIKANRDPASWGRVHVFIPALGGDESDPKFWRIVSYASPYLGSTAMKGDQENRWDKVAHTYGMWATVPDIDNFVLCVFINGDPDQGYYFACLPNQFGHHMIPAIASSVLMDKRLIQNTNLKAIVNSQPNLEPLPVVEFNENFEGRDYPGFEKYKVEEKPIHEPQALNLIRQGLDRYSLTGYRGYHESTIQRESPSNVFGISTPGPLLGKTTEYVKDYKIERGATRGGGHSFVMDDGFQATGSVESDRVENSLIRLRSTSGHQILLDDSNDILYIINNLGTGWIEINGAGHISIYAQDSVNIRTGNNINFHADKNINFNAGETINIRADETINIEGATVNVKGKKYATIFGDNLDIGTNGELNIFAKGKAGVTSKGELRLHGTKLMLNSGPGNTVTEPNDIDEYKHVETTKNSLGQWVQESEPELRSISPVVPTHEPWNRREGQLSLPDRVFQRRDAPNTYSSGPQNSIERTTPPAPVVIENFCGDYYVKDSSGNVVKDGSGQPVLNSAGAALDPGPKAALAAGVTKKLPKAWLSRPDAPNPSKGVGPLTIAQVKALMGQIAYTESQWRYQIRGGAGNNYLGRYQFGGPALSTVGFIKLDWAKKYGNDSINRPGAWTGKMGVNSTEDYLSNPAAQEAAMVALLESNYSAMTRNGAIKNGDDICCVGGMLATAHLIGAGKDVKNNLGALLWRETAKGNDKFQTTGTTYYNRGRYAVHELVK
jgi:hypothetical protein